MKKNISFGNLLLNSFLSIGNNKMEESTPKKYEDYKQFNLKYKELAFEVTRRCNMKCPHCMRGNAENHTISKEVVDKALDNVSMIGRLLLTGGEPFLEPEMIEYIFDGIIKREIPVMSINIVTNGTIRDKRIAESYNKITDYIAETVGVRMEWDKKQLRTIGKISVSNDNFHDDIDIMETLKFYREHLNQHTIITKESPTKKDETDYIIYLGNAKTATLGENQKYRYTVTPYRVRFLNDEDGSAVAIHTMIQIGYDGKVLIGEDSSYEQQDKNNYGNILEKPMSQLFAEGAFNEPFTEEEAHIHDMIYTMYMNKDYSGDMDEDFCKAFMYIFDAVYCTRERLQEYFPGASFEEVVEQSYHDMNIGMKEAYGEDFDFFRIDNLKKFDTPKEESIRKCNEFKLKYPLETLMWNLVSNTIDKSIKPLPDKITRDRYRRFKI